MKTLFDNDGTLTPTGRALYVESDTVLVPLVLKYIRMGYDSHQITSIISNNASAIDRIHRALNS